MYPAYTQLVAKWSSPSICDARATGWGTPPAPPQSYTQRPSLKMTLKKLLQKGLKQCFWTKRAKNDVDWLETPDYLAKGGLKSKVVMVPQYQAVSKDNDG